MKNAITFPAIKQPDEVTCGPTCLHGIYRFFNDEVPLEEVIEQVTMLEEGGTLAPLLGTHALRRGYKATIFSFNLNLFDPSWFALENAALQEKLLEQVKFKRSRKHKFASQAYLDFLRAGGQVKFSDLNTDVLYSYLSRDIPILVGLSATYLYRCKREMPETMKYDDVRGDPSGHFVILTGIAREEGLIKVQDPFHPNPLSTEGYYTVSIDHLICSILLGVVTYDANLLIVNP